MNRRQFLGTSLAAATAATVSGRARAASAGERKVLFVYNQGGWDPTRVFAPEFDNPNVDMESSAGESRAGEIPFVDHSQRPSVRSFLAANHQRTVVLNGVLVRAISHELCRMIALTGSTSGFAADWPALIAGASADRYVLPHLVVAGPSFPGDYGSLVARSGLNGQLDGLLSGEIIERADLPTDRPSRAVSQRLDQWLTGRAASRIAAATPGRDAALASAYDVSRSKAQALRALRDTMDFDAGEDLPDQAALAVRALSVGLSRCVSLAWPPGGQSGTWDSHIDNDPTQSSYFEELFSGLNDLVGLLQSTSGPDGGRLIDETLVVVWSEMGRTPQLNDNRGKDHWPYTSVLMFGGGLAGDRVVGAFDEGYQGAPVDPTTGEVTSSGEPLSAEMVGATVLAAAGIDPGDALPGVSPITAVLA